VKRGKGMIHEMDIRYRSLVDRVERLCYTDVREAVAVVLASGNSM
jgi:hypothetical protein